MRLTPLLTLLLVATELFAIQQDSLEYHARKSDYGALRKLTEQKLAKEESVNQQVLYYYSLSHQLDNSKKALTKVDSVLGLKIFDEVSVWQERLKALRVSLLRKNGRYQECIDEGKRLKSILSDSLAIFDVSHIISMSFRKMDQYDSALRWAIELEKSAIQLRDDLRLHRALQNRANLYDALKEYDKTLEMERQLIAIAGRLGNTDLQILDMCNLGSSFTNLKAYDSAKIYYQRALAVAEQNGNEKRIPLILYNIASLDEENEDYLSAIAVLRRCLPLAKQTYQPAIISLAHYLLADCYFKTNSIEEAKANITEGIAVAETHGFLQHRLYFLELQAEVFQSTSQSEKAIQTLQEIRSLEKSILNKERVETIEELEAKHETEKKERQIEDLEQEAVISNLKIRQQNIQLLGTLSFLLIGAVAGFTIYRNRNLKAEQQRLIVEQKLLRSQMNPHFLFNALSSVHGYIYEGDKKQASEYLSMFSELTRDILDHSSQELIQLSKELNTLEKYVNLQRIRFPGISYAAVVGDGVEPTELCIPPMLLQPFVENAIEHGLKGQESGTIKVRFEKTKDGLLCQIEDDGVGLSNEENKNHQSKAIEIARERISLLPGMKKRKDVLTVRNQKRGVLVELKLPLLEWV